MTDQEIREAVSEVLAEVGVQSRANERFLRDLVFSCNTVIQWQHLTPALREHFPEKAFEYSQKSLSMFKDVLMPESGDNGTQDLNDSYKGHGLDVVHGAMGWIGWFDQRPVTHYLDTRAEARTALLAYVNDKFHREGN